MAILKILRPVQAARYSGLSVHTLRWLRRTGKGPAWYRLSRKAVGYAIDDLESWLEQGKVETNAVAASMARDFRLEQLAALLG